MKRGSEIDSVIGIIPSRYGSTRFPGKSLAAIQGRPMVEWVYRAAKKALPRVIVATDDMRIFEAVRRFQGEAMMTPSRCRSGTDRMAYVAQRVKAEYYVNIQGDEPLISPDVIRRTARLAVGKKAIATAATELSRLNEENPNAVKVVVGEASQALYFSRSLIPFARDGKAALKRLKHLGLYAYPRAALLQFVRKRPCPLERTEQLEQLRALYYGMPIFVHVTNDDSIGVDTPQDLKEVERRLKRRAVRAS